MNKARRRPAVARQWRAAGVRGSRFHVGAPRNYLELLKLNFQDIEEYFCRSCFPATRRRIR